MVVVQFNSVLVMGVWVQGFPLNAEPVLPLEYTRPEEPIAGRVIFTFFFNSERRYRYVSTNTGAETLLSLEKLGLTVSPRCKLGTKSRPASPSKSFIVAASFQRRCSCPSGPGSESVSLSNYWEVVPNSTQSWHTRYCAIFLVRVIIVETHQ